jgi:hypothetical protein
MSFARIMEFSAILQVGWEQHVAARHSSLSLDSLALQEGIELAALINGTKAEKAKFRSSFKGRTLDGLSYKVSPLVHYPGADVLLAHTQDWTIFDKPDFHEGSDAFYLGENRSRNRSLQGFNPFSHSTVHRHDDEVPGKLKELFWSLHGQLFNWVEDTLHALSQDSRAEFQVKEGKLYHNGEIYPPGRPLPMFASPNPLQVYANQKHQAGTGPSPSLAALWMHRFMEHNHCKRDGCISELIDQLYR